MYAIYRGIRDRGTSAEVLRKVAVIGAISLVALSIGAVQVIATADHFRDTARARGIDYANVSRWSTPFQRYVELVFPNALGHHAAGDHTQYWASALYNEDSKVPYYFSLY